MTIERPMFPPVDPTRRGFLAQAAVAAAGGATLGLALPLPGLTETSPRVPDPIPALIERHRCAHAAHLRSIRVQARFERRYGDRARDVTEQPCGEEVDAFDTLVATPATTLPGLFAWLGYLQELDSAFETEWMITDRVFAPALLKSLAATLENIGVRP